MARHRNSRASVVAPIEPSKRLIQMPLRSGARLVFGICLELNNNDRFSHYFSQTQFKSFGIRMDKTTRRNWQKFVASIDPSCTDARGVKSSVASLSVRNTNAILPPHFQRRQIVPSRIA